MSEQKQMTSTTMENEITKIQSVEELISVWTYSPDKYSHLKVFLHLPRENDTKSNYLFLMISPTKFTKVELLDLSVEDDSIIVEFRDCAMQGIGNVKINVHDNKPQVLFVCWDDIRKMVMADSISHRSNEDLLEFEF